ncbi:hypothetical protein [Streptomyces sp. NPDC056227]|uniref:hypothetical protein n=1 Tax=Streptomyces sp. NPDC056227 TaxID=3345753 RepID=UPI0035D9B5BA
MTFAPKTWVVGEVVTAAIMNQEIRDQFNSMFGAWTSYTPTWTAATTNPTIGNGTLTGRYIKVGRTVTVSLLLIPGSTTTYGSGVYLFGLPFPAASDVVSCLGAARISGGATWIGHMLVGSSATSANLTFSNTTADTRGANMSDSKPETLAATAQVRATVTYQTAS